MVRIGDLQAEAKVIQHKVKIIGYRLKRMPDTSIKWIPECCHKGHCGTPGCKGECNADRN